MAIVLIVLLFVGLGRRDKAPQVQVANVTRDNLSASITSNGKVEPINAYITRVQFPTFVEKVFAAEGQALRRGQPVLTLAAADLRSQLAQARANLLTAQDDLRNARAGGPPGEVAQVEGDLRKAQIEVSGLERTQEALKQLVAKHAATQNDLDQNQNALAKAQATLQTAQQRKDDLARRAALDVDGASLRMQQAEDLLHSLEEKVRSATVNSPIEGTLYSLPVRAGDYVTVGQVLAEIADLGHVRVRAFVDEPDLGSLEPNQPVEITWDARPSQVWTGHTEQVPKQVVALGNRSVGEVLCSVDNTKLELLPNVNVAVRILVRERTGVLVVPRAAVRTDGANHFVFVLAGDRLRRRSIDMGIASTGKYEVIAGLQEGERVALPGELDLSDGMAVRPKESE
ncbi:MAG: efflux RND transporter periplasmic adaptor subunit [Candidatus Acidiferrales bacterium]